MVFVGANKASALSAGERTCTCAYGVSDNKYAVVLTHDTARNIGLELWLARLVTESNGVVARVACRCALGGTLLPFGVRDLHRARVRRNDTAPRTHEFAQFNGTRNYGVVLHHGRAQPATICPGCGNTQRSRYSGAGRHFQGLARTQVIWLLQIVQGV